MSNPPSRSRRPPGPRGSAVGEPHPHPPRRLPHLPGRAPGRRNQRASEAPKGGGAHTAGASPSRRHHSPAGPAAATARAQRRSLAESQGSAAPSPSQLRRRGGRRRIDPAPLRAHCDGSPGGRADCACAENRAGSRERPSPGRGGGTRGGARGGPRGSSAAAPPGDRRGSVQAAPCGVLGHLRVISLGISPAGSPGANLVGAELSWNGKRLCVS